MKVKVCGITCLEDAEMCELMGADALGFVNFQGRARSLPIKNISDICSSVSPAVTKVLVCAPSSAHEGLRMLEQSGADAVQLHSLSPEDIGMMKKSGASVMRVVRPVREEAARYAHCSDALVFEDGVPGTGASYDYSQIPFDVHPRCIIAGGLNAQTIDLAKSLDPYGVDVSSGVERVPGRKDPELVQEFIRRCRT